MDEIDAEMWEAIRLHQGARLNPGARVGHTSDQTIYIMVRYDGDMAVVRHVDGSEKQFPASEIFDVQAVKDAAVEIHVKKTLKKMGGSLLN